MIEIVRQQRGGLEVRLGRCPCGELVQLDRFTNTCACGRDYNGSGQELAPRSQWGEETGESLEEILAVDDRLGGAPMEALIAALQQLDPKHNGLPYDCLCSLCAYLREAKRGEVDAIGIERDLLRFVDEQSAARVRAALEAVRS